MQTLSKSAAVAVLCAAAWAAPATAADIDYPVDPATLVTHSSPGGGTDVFLREMVGHLGPVMGTTFVVENVRGGSGAKAMAKLATSPADGSICYGTTPTYINTSLLSSPRYTYKDLQPVANVFLDPQVVYTRASSEYDTLAEVMDAAEENPGDVRVGVTTPGSLDRQVMEKLKEITGVDVIVVTHDGGGDLLINVLNGTVAMGIGEVQELKGQLEAGELKLLGTYTKERLDNFPDLPTAREQGIDLVVNKFRGIACPEGLPDPVIKDWENGIQAVLEDPDFKEWYQDSSLVPAFMPHDEYEAFINDFAEEQQDFFVKYGITED